MKVKIFNAAENYVLTLVQLDELSEKEGWTDEQYAEAYEELERTGRYWIGSDRLVMIADRSERFLYGGDV